MRDSPFSSAASEKPRYLRVTSLTAQAPTVPLVNENFTSLAGEQVDNYQVHPIWGPLLDQLWVK